MFVDASVNATASVAAPTRGVAEKSATGVTAPGGASAIVAASPPINVRAWVAVAVPEEPATACATVATSNTIWKPAW